MEDFFEKRIRELSQKSANRYTFTYFLGLEEQSELNGMKREVNEFSLFGGCDSAERVVARFGRKEDFGYEEDFPIKCIKCNMKTDRFTEAPVHRDVLGALMNLGIERKCIGDIGVTDGCAYIFTLDKTADFICENLTKIKHTCVECEVTEELPQSELYKLENTLITVASMRCDCLIAEVYGLSRSECNRFFEKQKVFVNGKSILSPATQVKEDDTVSVRGKGRFKVGEKSGITRKGNTRVEIGKYV